MLRQIPVKDNLSPRDSDGLYSPIYACDGQNWELRTGVWTSTPLLLSIYSMLAYMNWQKAKKCSVYSNTELKSAWEHLRSAQDLA